MSRLELIRAAATEAPPEQTYLDWDLENTVVISGPLNRARAGIPGRRFASREEAHKWLAATYGRVERVRHPWRWAGRVIRPTAPGGRYTPPAGTRELPQELVVISVGQKEAA